MLVHFCYDAKYLYFTLGHWDVCLTMNLLITGYNWLLSVCWSLIVHIVPPEAGRRNQSRRGRGGGGAVSQNMGGSQDTTGYKATVISVMVFVSPSWLYLFHKPLLYFYHQADCKRYIYLPSFFLTWGIGPIKSCCQVYVFF